MNDGNHVAETRGVGMEVNPCESGTEVPPAGYMGPYFGVAGKPITQDPDNGYSGCSFGVF